MFQSPEGDFLLPDQGALQGRRAIIFEGFNPPKGIFCCLTTPTNTATNTATPCFNPPKGIFCCLTYPPTVDPNPNPSFQSPEGDFLLPDCLVVLANGEVYNLFQSPEGDFLLPDTVFFLLSVLLVRFQSPEGDFLLPDNVCGCLRKQQGDCFNPPKGIFCCLTLRSGSILSVKS